MPDHGLQLHRSNRLETLAAELCGWLREVGGDPFRAPVVLVQSLGMERWLRLEIAARLGVCAHVQFPFPRAFVWELLRGLEPDLPRQSPWESAALAWRLYGLLPEVIREPVFAPLRHYLEDGDERKRHQLAGRLANLFDQYLLFRGDLLRGWDNGGEDDSAAVRWQAELWRRLTAQIDMPHPARLQEKLLQHLKNAQAPLPSAPAVAAFGISALPPFYLEVLNRLPVPGGVRWFELHPCREYWADIPTRREAARAQLRQRFGADDDGWLEHAANPLLASMGRLGRDFLRLLLEQTDFNTGAENFEEIAPGSLLGTVQHDILHNLARGSSDDAPKLPLTPDDDSLRVHSCHGPLREIEVLRDQMLDWFQRDATLQPRDVLVMVPDIATYAPLVQAVFGAGGRTIPFSVADLAPSRGDRTVTAFLQLLRLPETRLGASAVLALLESELVRAKFNLAETDLPQIREWVAGSGIRWGRDADHRAELGLPAQSENSWRAGIERLLLGVAMTGADGLFAGRIASDGIGGKPALMLGRFVEFAERVFAVTGELQRARSLSDWVQLLRRIIDSFFSTEDGPDAGITLLRDAVRQLEQHAELSSLTDAVPLSVVLQALEPALANDSVHRGFLTGRVTFGALKPMRSLPFRIVCLVGMNDGAFPRHDPVLSFDLISKAPRSGDTSRRVDDRYLFLETLLSARERLHISYVGQSEREGSQLPPSVVVSELLDCLDASFTVEPGKERASEFVVVRHRLQAFHSTYFNGTDPRIFSYSAENLAASEKAGQARASFRLVEKPLPAPDAEWRTVSVDQLAEFFSNPARYFAQRRLQLRLPRAEDVIEDREPFEIAAGLEATRFRQEILEARLHGVAVGELEARIRAQMRLPAGATGAAVFRNLVEDVQDTFERVMPHREDEVAQRPEIDLVLNGFRVTGVVGEIWPTSGLLLCRAAKITGKDLLAAWLRHLAWNAITDGNGGMTHVVGSGKTAAEVERWLDKPEDAPELLAQLLAIYWRGLSEPLKLFPKTSLALMQALRNPKIATQSGALAKAEEAWISTSEFTRGESEDEYCALFFRQMNPLDDEFMALAQQVFGPLLDHLEEGE